MPDFEPDFTGAEQEDLLRALFSELTSADDDARARYFATVLEQLMQYPNFQSFMRDNFAVMHKLDKKSGVLAVAVVPVADVPQHAQQFVQAFAAVRGIDVLGVKK